MIRTLLFLFGAQVAQAYITSHGAVPAHRQREWLKQMTKDLCQIQPGKLSELQLSQANEIMYAWSHTPSIDKENALAVESLLKRVIDERRAGNINADLTVEDYNCLLEGWAKAGQGPAAAERCEQILTAMQEQGPLPDMDSFKATLMAWRQASQQVSFAPIRAQRILEWMIRLYQQGENEAALPDADCFDLVLQTWSRSGLEQAPTQAEKILGVMERLYESTGLTKLKPRTLSFNAVLAAWAKSGAPESGKRSADILSFMELLESQGDTTVAPDSASYCTVMGSLSKSADRVLAAKMADAFLSHVTERYAEGKPIVPDTILFNTAMGCWAKANVSGSYRRARSILDRQLGLYQAGCRQSRPDVYGYTSVIASCAAESGDKMEKAKAFDVALMTFRELQSHAEDSPNHVTYGTMLKACGRLLPLSSPMRKRWVQRIFQNCCENGCVGDMVVARLREAATPDVYKTLMNGYKKRDLPSEWTENVHENNEVRKKRMPKRKRAEV